MHSWNHFYLMGLQKPIHCVKFDELYAWSKVVNNFKYFVLSPMTTGQQWLGGNDLMAETAVLELLHNKYVIPHWLHIFY